MDIRQYLIIFYAFFWVVRINGCFRRGRQPLLRGPQWFFDVRVSPDFYTGSGRKILHRYWLRMLLPFALDIPVAAVIFLSGQLQFLNWLILALCAVIHLNHSFSVDLAERQARHLALPEADLPVATVALSLTPRRLRDYTNRNLEWALALSCVGGFSWLLRYYFASPHHHNLRLLFGLPVYFLYLQLGLLLVKCIVVAWRSPIPQAHAAEHLAAREETRKYYLRVCDWHRLGLTAAILFWPVKLSYSALHANRLLTIWFFTWLLFSFIVTVWVEIRRKQLVALSLRARPVTLPDFLHQSELARWPLCYQPSVPMLVLKGARGYSLNLANSITHFGAAYLIGLIALRALLPPGH